MRRSCGDDLPIFALPALAGVAAAAVKRVGGCEVETMDGLTSRATQMNESQCGGFTIEWVGGSVVGE